MAWIVGAPYLALDISREPSDKIPDMINGFQQILGLNIDYLHERVGSVNQLIDISISNG